MKILVLVLTVSVAGFAIRQQAPISADEVTLRHRIYGDQRVTIFLLDIPAGQATVMHRHDRDMLSVFVNGGRTRASFNGAAPVEDSFTPGDVRFRSAGFTHSTENIGSGRFLRANDRILVAVSGYTFSEDIAGAAPAVHARKTGEIEPMAAGPARRWSNAGDPSHLIVVTFR
jgi:hypothetical protein